jgi:RNAse (barnase) inhibitor barstar
MSVFSAEEANDQRRDWVILRDGGVALYWRPEVLKADLDWLELNEYNIVEFDSSKWKSEEQMHDALRSGLSFPYYYGKNLDSLNDCLSDIDVPDNGGLALVFHHHDQFAKIDETVGASGVGPAQAVLHIFAGAVRYHMLLGRRLLILVQSDDPGLTFGDLAGVSAKWNPREWRNKDHGL